MLKLAADKVAMAILEPLALSRQIGQKCPPEDFAIHNLDSLRICKEAIMF